jgi:hypothetical protein
MVKLEWCVVPVRRPWGLAWGVSQDGRTTLAYVNRAAAVEAAIGQAKAATAAGEPAAAATLIAGRLRRLWPPLSGRRTPDPLG